LILEADALLKASIMIKSSIKFSLTGVQVGWTTNTSTPRTLSSIAQLISPSENLDTLALPTGIPRYLAISAAKSGLALPENSFILHLDAFIS
jgi:hypothetical protein